MGQLNKQVIKLDWRNPWVKFLRGFPQSVQTPDFIQIIKKEFRIISTVLLFISSTCNNASILKKL